MSTLMVASSGGHLRELHHLAPRIRGHDGDLVWVTVDNLQSRSLLAGEAMIHVRDHLPRDARPVLLNLWLASNILRTRRVRHVICTGAAGVALSFLPVAWIRGVPAHYIELSTRVSAPSPTGRLVHRLPGVRCYSQYPTWSGWHYRGSVLDGFAVLDVTPPLPPLRRVVVTLGTSPHGFRALVTGLLRVIPAGVETLWQTGSTPVADLPIRARPWLSPDELAGALRQADVVVTHAGVGATLDALDAGRCPIVVPRRPTAGEQVDDHQLQLAAELERRGLAISCTCSELSLETLAGAASRRVVRTGVPAPFDLVV
jgi:UDP-N-acetylglucosamine transferase subunit ALG13